MMKPMKRNGRDEARTKIVTLKIMMLFREENMMETSMMKMKMVKILAML